MNFTVKKIAEKICSMMANMICKFSSKRLLLLSILVSPMIVNAQKIGGFYDNIYNFSYPTRPLPSNITNYKVEDNIDSKSITAYDYRNELISIYKINRKLVEYSNDYRVKSTNLRSFQKVGKANSGNNTAHFILDMSDILVSYEKTKNDTIYIIRAKANAHYKVSNNSKVIYQDSVLFNEKIGEVYSKLSSKDFKHQAVNQYEQFDVDINNKVLAKFLNSYHSFIAAADLTYNSINVPFFKMKKLKKLASPEIPTDLEKRIRALKSIDKGLVSRRERDEVIKELIEDFKKSIDNQDFKDHDTYKGFIYGNLGSLFRILEEFDTALDNYNLAKKYITKSSVKSYVSNSINKITNQKKLKTLIIENDNLKEQYSENYNKMLTKYIN